MSTPSTSVNTAVVAPIPSASVTTAIVVNEAWRTSPRSAYLRSLSRPVIFIVSFRSHRASIQQVRMRARSRSVARRDDRPLRKRVFQA